jgi:hypothetical protein
MTVFEVVLSLAAKLPKSLREAIIPDMLIPPIANDPSKVQLARISHVYFEHPDLEKFARFANDFGFVEEKRIGDTIYFRGYGRDPYVYVASKSKDGKQRFRGPAFVAASEEEFDKAAKLGGAQVGSLGNAPGGGKIITFSRPDNTFFHVVYGQVEREVASQEPTATHEQQGPFNKPFEKPRRGTDRLFIRSGRCPQSLTSMSRTVSALPPRAGPCSQTWPLRLCRPQLRY